MTDEKNIVPVFIPELGAILLATEDKKGEPLTPDEVLDLRDNATCIMMDAADAAKMNDSREYRDIDPENCWYDWQVLRRELGRKPDLDAGAKMYQVKSNDPEYQATIDPTQRTLDDFRNMIPRFEPPSVMVKTKLTDGDGNAFIWLFNARTTGTGFVAELFEIPDTVPSFVVGDMIEIDEGAVLDWMINDNGTMHGGFSLRYHRERLDPLERAEFDGHIGVTKYA